MASTAVDIQTVSKHFRLYHEKYTTLKERVLHAGRIPYEDFWALREIDAQIRAGETVGILGRNGSGKSTLLKCIGGILQPTSGQIVVRGQLAAMLELGAGMQPDLSGRDNVYLNGSLLGLSRREIDKRFDEIVAFAELEEFIDNQVKYYSSGMYVRLGFAVAVNVEPDVLLIDEVLAVGDERFQQKCMDRVKQFQRDGRTIIFVSHSADVMRQICERVMVLERGEVLTIATPGEAIAVFRESLLEHEGALGVELEDAEAEAQTATRRRLRIIGVEALVPDDLSRTHLLPGDSFEIRASYEATAPVPGVSGAVSIFGNTGGLVFGTDTASSGQVFDLPMGKGCVVLRFPSIPLLEGMYTVNVQLQDARSGLVHDVAENAVHFQVINPGRSSGLVLMQVEAAVERDDPAAEGGLPA
jgi:ABC-2 type transport system ATP-binding protein